MSKVPPLFMPKRNRGTPSIFMLDDLRAEFLPQNPHISNTLYDDPKPLKHTNTTGMSSSLRNPVSAGLENKSFLHGYVKMKMKNYPANI